MHENKPYSMRLSELQEEVEKARKSEIDLADSARLLAHIKEIHEELKALKSEAFALEQRMRETILPQRLEDAGLEKISVKDLGTIYVVNALRVKTKNKEGLIEALENNGFSDLVQETVNPATLKAFVKNLQEEGDPFLETLNDVVQIDAYSDVRIRKK